MSRGWRRYGEARLYLIGGSAGLLVVLWSVLLAQDRAASSEAGVQTAAEAAASSTESLSPSSQRAASQTTTRGS